MKKPERLIGRCEVIYFCLGLPTTNAQLVLGTEPLLVGRHLFCLHDDY